MSPYSMPNVGDGVVRPWCMNLTSILAVDQISLLIIFFTFKLKFFLMFRCVLFLIKISVAEEGSGSRRCPRDWCRGKGGLC